MVGRGIDLKGEETIPSLLTALGLAVFFVFILGVGVAGVPATHHGRARLWYSLFLRWPGAYLPPLGLRWILSFAHCSLVVFIIVCITKPDIHSKVCSRCKAWFAPRDHLMFSSRSWVR